MIIFRDGCLILYRRDNDRPWLQYHIQDCHDNGQKEVTAVEAIERRSEIIAVTGSAQSPELKFFAFFKEENRNSMYVVRAHESSKFLTYLKSETEVLTSSEFRFSYLLQKVDGNPCFCLFQMYIM